MARKPPRLFEPRRDTYRWLTHRPLHCLILVVPLLGLFHLGSAFSQTTLLASRDLERILGVFGATAWYLPPALIVGVLLLMQWGGKFRWRVYPAVLAGMVGESLFWALPLFAVNYLCARLLNTSGLLAAGEATAFQRVLLAVGAGVYEEFLFRLVLVGVLAWSLADVLGMKKDYAILIALVAGALAFSLYHFSWSSEPSGAGFTWGSFIFRALAGVCLGVVFAYRGFGIAVGAHTLWNLYYVASHP